MGTTDLDSILWIADMASHYGADPQTIKSFLRRAGEKRLLMAKQAAKAIRSTAKVSYSKMKTQVDETRLLAEGKALLLIAGVFKRPKGVPEGQQSLLNPSAGPAQ